MWDWPRIYNKVIWGPPKLVGFDADKLAGPFCLEKECRLPNFAGAIPLKAA
jgi:hypothetical protein